MYQSLNILGMAAWDLKEYIDGQLMDNPVLEIESSEPTDSESFFASVSIPYEKEYDPFHQLWEERGLSENVTSKPAKRDLYEPIIGDLYHPHKRETLAQSLREQLIGIGLDSDLFEICIFLSECLDHRGYLDFELSDIAGETGIQLTKLQEALSLLQSLTPTGVAACNLEECLLLQLAKNGLLNPYTRALVKDGLFLLAGNNVRGISNLLKCSEKDALHWAEVVRGLNPIPSQGYATCEPIIQIIPDAMIIVENGLIQITLNKAGIPRLEISADYQALIKSSENKDTKKYLNERILLAKSLIRSVEGRDKTLYNILLSLSEIQPRFFEDGKSLVPVTMGEIAELLDLHISTVSRAVQNKYIICAAGTIPLRSLFTSGIKFKESGLVSNKIICQKIKDMIDEEDVKKPLSDEKLRSMLVCEGIDISRRTVAKYREDLGIFCSSKRRRRG